MFSVPVVRFCLRPGPLCEARMAYHSVLSPPSSVLEFAYDLRRRKHEAARPEGYQAGSVLASYIHLHWGSAPEAAGQFVSHCAEWAKGR